VPEGLERLKMPKLSLEKELLRRQTFLGPSLSTHYNQPLVIEQGKGTFLFDYRGQAFLDCVNNPASLGHSHPHVVKAASEQLIKLNTNTRYVYPELADYAEALTKTLPPNLTVCFFVNSGSEANDLALRMVKQYTKQSDIVCIQGGYHGHTGELIKISPYKYEGKGGFAPPETTWKVPCPDVFRGVHRNDPKPGESYAAYVEKTVDEIRAKGRKPAAFFCEGMLSTAGYIALPPGYLPNVYKAIRGAGGVCVSDEVQSGFARAGENKMWGFQLSGVQPDVVTMGKPMGNGFPLAAVVTTKEIADSFANGMEYFNTFGGGPVAMRVGKAVLQAIESDGILDNVDQVGKYFKKRLTDLCKKHEMAGNVRGSGLFLGLELVKSKASLTPASAETDWIVEAARCRGVLLGTDGLANNVLKIKPPLCFSREHADLVHDILDEIIPLIPKGTPEAIKASMKELKEDASWLNYVNSLVQSCGVGAGPTWRNQKAGPQSLHTWGGGGAMSVALASAVFGFCMGVIISRRV